MVRRHVCIQRTCNEGLCMPDLESLWLVERLAYLGRSLTGMQCGDENRVELFLATSQTQRLKVDVSGWAKHCFSASAKRPFVTFLGPVTFHGLRKSCIGRGTAGRQRRTAPTGIGR